MIPVQNFNHRQSTSLLFRQYESRKHSPVTHVVVQHPQRRSQQYDGRSNSPSKFQTTLQAYPKIMQSYEIQQRLPTQGQTIPIQEALKIYSSKHHPDSMLNSTKTVSSILHDRFHEKSNCTKTSTGDSQEEEKSFKFKNSSQNIAFQKQMLDKDLQIIQLQKEIKQLKDSTKKYHNLERDYERILQENQKLKQQLALQQLATQVSSPGRPSEYVCALSEQDKMKIRTLLECD